MGRAGWRWVVAVGALVLPAACFFDLASLEVGSGGSAASSGAAGGGAAGGAAEGGAGGMVDAYAAAVLEDGAIAYWRLDETEGAVAHDDVGNHDATVLGGATFGAPGAMAGSSGLSLDGGNLDVGDVFDFPGFAPYSFEAWVRLASYPQNDFVRLFEKDEVTMSGRNGQAFLIGDPSSSGFAYGLERWVDGMLDCHTHFDDLNEPLPLDVFAHVVVTFDGSSLRMFVDGAEKQSTTCNMPQTDVQTLFRWGTAPSGSSLFRGTLDELAVYDAALPSARVIAHHEIGLGN